MLELFPSIFANGFCDMCAGRYCEVFKNHICPNTRVLLIVGKEDVVVVGTDDEENPLDIVEEDYEK